MEKLALFDVDRTLVRGSLVHRIAFTEAFRHVYGIDADIDLINHHGMTDQQIIIEVLKKKGFGEQAVLPRLGECMAAMLESFGRVAEKEEVVILAGVPELLEALDKRGVLLGLVTGGLEPIARNKLEKAGVNRYFRFGGFGADGMNRADLVRIALQRAEEGFGFRPGGNAFLFGDAPQDMAAGKKAGLLAVGVTTGIYSRESLEKAGADFVLENLGDKSRVFGIMGL